MPQNNDYSLNVSDQSNKLFPNKDILERIEEENTKECTIDAM